MLRILSFFKKYYRFPSYIIAYAVAYFLPHFTFGTHLYSKDEAAKLLKEGKSLIRLGDGEINLLLNLRNHYEAFDPRLKLMMRKIITGYFKNSPYMLSVPRFINVSNKELRTMGKFNVWLPLKVVFFLLFPKHVPYMDAHNFYYDGFFEEYIAPTFRDKKVVLITKRETLEKQKANRTLPWQDFLSVETPAHEALSSYERIKQDIDRTISGLKREDVVLLFALGPVGKFLMFEYAALGYQSIDIGKVAEVMFTGESIQYLI